MPSGRLGLLAASTVLALALFVVTGAAGASPQCSGIQVRTGDDLAKVAANNPAGTTFCVDDGDYPVSSNIDVDSGDDWIGVYSDGTRPTVRGVSANVDHVFFTGGTTNVLIQGLDVSGAVHEDACEPRCGRGIGAGGDNVTIRDVRAHHNENAGIGGMGENLLVEDTELDNNGSHDAARDENDGDASAKVSAAGLKTTGSATLLRVNAHDNYWAGIWCDVSCGAWDVRDSRAKDNGKVGMHYEISDGPAVFANNVITGNGKGHPAWGSNTYESRFGGMLLLGSYNIEVYGNTFGDNAAGNGILASSDPRNGSDGGTGTTSNLKISIHDNAMNGDTIRGCSLSGVSCSEADVMAPKITDAKPADGEKGKRRRANVAATFSKEMDPSTLTGNSVTLINTKTGSFVEAEVSCDDPCKAVTIDPGTRLARKTTYEVVITTEAKDLVGQAMEENETWTFTTGRR